MKLSELRKWNGGTLPAYVDGGYPVLYFDRDNETLCAKCANETGDARQADIFYEGAAETCAECGTEIESAYGDPDAPDPCPGCGAPADTNCDCRYNCDGSDDCICLACKEARGERD